jgi:hypothetical protein
MPCKTFGVSFRIPRPLFYAWKLKASKCHKNEAERLKDGMEELKANHEAAIAQSQKQAANPQRVLSDSQETGATIKVEVMAALYCQVGPSIGVRTVPVPHGPDGSVLRFPYPCRSDLISTTWTDGGRDGLGPSKTVRVRPSRPLRRLDGYLQTIKAIIAVVARSPPCGSLQEPNLSSTRFSVDSNPHLRAPHSPQRLSHHQVHHHHRTSRILLTISPPMEPSPTYSLVGSSQHADSRSYYEPRTCHPANYIGGRYSKSSPPCVALHA